jgi:hypothetical protein
MPALSFFIDEHDSGLLLDRLNADPEIAFIAPEDADGDGEHSPGSSAVAGREPTWPMERPRRWKAVQTMAALRDGLQSLWHVPAGPLPLIELKDPRVLLQTGTSPMPLVAPARPLIADPWRGWTGTNQFGSGCHPWIRLELWMRHRPYTKEERASLKVRNAFWDDKNDMLVVSGFQWTGSHFHPAPAQTQRWWNRMKGWIDRNAARLHTNPSFWAFPSAHQKLKTGMRYYARNWDLPI